MLNGLALSSGKQDLIIDPPIMNSAGMLGFSPTLRLPFDLSPLGAFVTHPLSLRPRMPARPAYAETYPGGVLLHTGLPNAGFRETLRDHSRTWGTHSQPVVAHLIGDSRQDIAAMVDLLNGRRHPVQALEIGLELSSLDEVQAVLTAAGQCQLPLLARFPLGTEKELISAAIEAGVNALVLGPPRGSLLNAKGEIISGRLYGPGIFPLAIKALENLVQTVQIPVILGCGVFSGEHLLAALKTGAAGVQLDTILWVDPIKILQEIQTLIHPKVPDNS